MFLGCFFFFQLQKRSEQPIPGYIKKLHFQCYLYSKPDNPLFSLTVITAYNIFTLVKKMFSDWEKFLFRT